jgi:hypothetical protein
MTEPTAPLEHREERTRALRFGWTSLAVWALLGLALEAAHGWKLAMYLDDALAQRLLRLGHAHGVLLACVHLLYAVAGVPLLASRDDGGRSTGRLLRVAGVLMPIGFALSAWGHSESDPGLAIWLVPIGGLCLLAGLFTLARQSYR